MCHIHKTASELLHHSLSDVFVSQLYLLLLQPKVCQLLLVLTVKSFELLAVLFQVVVFSDKLGVLPPDRFHLLLQLSLVAQDAAVQHAGGKDEQEYI